MKIGCSLPAKTFMPEYKEQQTAYDPLESLLYGYETAMRIGYDYIEAAVGVLHDLSEEQLQLLARKVKSDSFRLQYCNCFVPPEIPLCTAPMEQIEAFVHSTMCKLDMLDVRTVIFGSGAARRFPDGMTKEAACERICAFLKLCNAVGSDYGITTAVEPLNSTETNIINSAAEGAEWIRKLDLPYVRLLPDMFHMAMENEDPHVLTENEDIIVHLHASEAPGRVFPGKFGGAYLKKCGEVLRASHWTKNITVECVFSDFESEAVQALKFMKEAF